MAQSKFMCSVFAAGLCFSLCFGTIVQPVQANEPTESESVKETAESAVYTISLNANGGSFPDSQETLDLEYQENSNIPASLSDYSDPVKDGFSFSGWQGENGKIYKVGSDGSVSYANGDPFYVTSDLYWTALWTPQISESNSSQPSATDEQMLDAADPGQTASTSTGTVNMAEMDRETTPMLAGSAFRQVIPDPVSSICFIRDLPRESDGWTVNETGSVSEGTFLDVSEAKDGSVVAYLYNETLCVSPADSISNIVFNTDCSGMFQNLTGLTDIEFSNADLSNVTNMDSMFAGCISLKRIMAPDWSRAVSASGNNMFTGDNSLPGFDASQTSFSKARQYPDGYFGAVRNVNAEDNDHVYFSFEPADISYSLMARSAEPVMLSGWGFDTLIPSDVTAIYFDDGKPAGSEGWRVTPYDKLTDYSFRDVSAAVDGSVLAYVKGTEMHVCPRDRGEKIIFNVNCENLFTLPGDNNDPVSEIYFGQNIDTSRVKNFRGIFAKCPNLKSLDLSAFDTSSATDFSYFVYACPSLETITGMANFNVANVVNMNNIASGDVKLEGFDMSGWRNAKNTTLSYAFYNDQQLQELDMRGFNTVNTTDLEGAFRACINLKHVYGLSEFDTSKVTSIETMLCNDSSFEDNNFSNFDTSNVVRAGYVFLGTPFTELDLSTWRTPKIERFIDMFYQMPNIQTIKVPNFTVTSGQDFAEMFMDCPNLEYIYGDYWHIPSGANTTQMFADSPKLPGYDASQVGGSKAQPYPGGYFVGYINVQFDPAGGTMNDDATVTTLTYLNGTKNPINSGSYSVPVKPGYTFEGWDSSTGKAYYFSDSGAPLDASGKALRLSENVTLTAQWKLIVGTITVNKVWIDTMPDEQRNIPANVPIITITTKEPD